MSAPFRKKLSFSNIGAVYVLLVIIAIFSIWLPDTFPDLATVKQILNGNAVLAMIALSLLIPLTAGTFDLSTAYTASFSGVLVAKLIVADPRNPRMKDILNERIKRREPFRPFAPSVLANRVGEWFEQDYTSPFMVLVYKTRAERRAQIPAVNHVDDTGRVQSVEARVSPRYHRLIEEFDRQTGVPIVLNTSFNENEPIVMTPDHAVDCFVKTRMDVLVLGNLVVERERVAA